MALRPWLSFGNLARQFGAALLLKKTTGWRYFMPWLASGALRSIPVAGGAVGMGCIGYGRHPVWEVTEACNLRCAHCHATSSEPSPGELTTAEGKRLIRQVIELRYMQMLVYTGGEPLMRPDLDELLAFSRDEGLVNVIATNGTLIDDARARELKRLGVRGVAVSLDSTDPAVHNRIRRNPRAFELALRGIEACKRAGMVVQLNYTAMKPNLHTLEDVIAFAHEIRADIMLCYQLVPMGRGSAIADWALSAEENRALVETVKRMQRDVFTIVEPVAAPQYWASLLGRDREGVRTPARPTFFHGCAAGWGLVYVKPDGEVWPCPFVPVSGGNVREKRLVEIVTRSKVFRDLSDRNNLKGKCGECANRFICGGCRGKAYAETGDYLAEDPTCYLHHEGRPSYSGLVTGGVQGEASGEDDSEELPPPPLSSRCL